MTLLAQLGVVDAARTLCAATLDAGGRRGLCVYPDLDVVLPATIKGAGAVTGVVGGITVWNSM